MKKVMYAILAVMLVVGLMGCTQAVKGKPGPTLTVDTPKVKMSKKAKVEISGTGFTPGQEVRLLFTAIDGITSDIGYALKPQPVADQTGTWKTTWSCGRYVKKKLIKAGTYTIKATDSDYDYINDATVEFY